MRMCRSRVINPRKCSDDARVHFEAKSGINTSDGGGKRKFSNFFALVAAAAASCSLCLQHASSLLAPANMRNLASRSICLHLIPWFCSSHVQPSCGCSIPSHSSFPSAIQLLHTHFSPNPLFLQQCCRGRAMARCVAEPKQRLYSHACPSLGAIKYHGPAEVHPEHVPISQRRAPYGPRPRLQYQ